MARTNNYFWYCLEIIFHKGSRVYVVYLKSPLWKCLKVDFFAGSLLELLLWVLDYLDSEGRCLERHDTGGSMVHRATRALQEQQARVTPHMLA
jgi:hypothetical protein